MALLAVSFTGCKKGASGKTKGSSITINISTEPGTLDPRKASAHSDVTIISMFMEGLTRTDKSGKNSLALAKSVDISPDRKTYTFQLRHSKWSNGDPVTSYDFSYAWKKSLTPTFNTPSAHLLYVIKNAKQAKLGSLPLSLVGIETPNDKTLVVTLNNPAPYFLDLVANPIYFPVNSKVDRTNPYWAENSIGFVGNGPFVLSSWKHYTQLEATKNKEYWDHDAVKLSHVNMVMLTEETRFKMFDIKELNWDGSPFSTIPVDAIHSLKGKEKLQIAPTLATQWIRVNTEKKPFGSSQLRRALGYAINRQAIVDHIVQGNQIPATGIVPPSMKLQKAPLFKDGDIELACTLFKEEMENLGLSPSKFPEVTLLYTSSKKNHLIAQALQDQWLKVFGIHIELEAVPKTVFFDRISKKDYTLSLGSWSADFNDPINFLEVFKTKDVGTNNTNWEMPRYTELLETSFNCKTPEERLAVLAKSEEILINEMPVIPIFHYTMLYVQDQELKDVVLTTMGNIDFKWAHLD
jgi:oligopeptide transport system substrate-binding protein